jgi:hypothetical protein
LPIAQVVLFSSGVGYFQREGEVQGTSRVDLSFPVQDINDLLKSMVLQDLGGGHISAVSYDSQAPVEKTLRSFAINLTNNPTFGQILNQARGEKVEVTLQQGNAVQPAALTGVIVGVERKKETAPAPSMPGVPALPDLGGLVPEKPETLNLWCAEGLRNIKLADVQRVRFLNPTMETEVKKALEVLAMSHDTQKKAVSLSFTGEGKRAVKVGYVVENPIWKTSYRLVMSDKGKPHLQGWAVVENTQDDDWTNVRMSLVSGRPISFRMDLYQPLFVQRPVVEPELFASLRPPTYSGNLEPPAADFAPKQKKEEAKEELEMAPGKAAPGGLGGMGRYPLKIYNGAAESKMAQAILDPRQGVASSAIAMQLGDFFQYKIEHPVTLQRQKSAMLPIVGQDVEGTKVSIYNEQTHAKFPLLGLKFKNTTKLHLNQGPITVFDNSSYAGDARILDLQPKEERLISYAIDLGTEVEPIAQDTKDHIIKIKVTQGLLEATHKVRDSKTYTVKNRSDQERTLLIEHPYRPEFKLLSPEKFSERARDVYRFEMEVPAGKTAKLDVVEEQELANRIQLNNTADDTLHFFLSQNAISAEDKANLQQGMALKAKFVATRQEIVQKERRLNDIRQDQARLRENLKTVPQGSEAYKRYVKKFDDQETEIEQIQDTIKKLQETEFRQRQDFDAFWPTATSTNRSPEPSRKEQVPPPKKEEAP